MAGVKNTMRWDALICTANLVLSCLNRQRGRDSGKYRLAGVFFLNLERI